MSKLQLLETIKRFNDKKPGDPEREKLASQIEVEIKQKFGKIALKVV